MFASFVVGVGVGVGDGDADGNGSTQLILKILWRGQWRK
jgi:hypothetical protein